MPWDLHKLGVRVPLRETAEGTVDLPNLLVAEAISLLVHEQEGQELVEIQGLRTVHVHSIDEPLKGPTERRAAHCLEDLLNFIRVQLPGAILVEMVEGAPDLLLLESCVFTKKIDQLLLLKAAEWRDLFHHLVNRGLIHRHVAQRSQQLVQTVDVHVALGLRLEDLKLLLYLRQFVRRQSRTIPRKAGDNQGEIWRPKEFCNFFRVFLPLKLSCSDCSVFSPPLLLLAEPFVLLK
mmetsp:Transcript_7825/g.18089  ORF Transcript_7825/g.18089 Transcript_7825/m.18089 type:complete len:235 (-) Transcript_7825:373-1077(-)